jgi:hypothetical protein
VWTKLDRISWETRVHVARDVAFFFFSSFMSSVLKAQRANAEAKGRGKRKAEGDVDVDEPKKKRNKQRVLLLSSRGITHRMRHLMNDVEALLPHVKKGELGLCLAYLCIHILRC